MRTLGRLLWLSITLFLVMFSVVFATSNKTLITLYLWPFDSALTAPVICAQAHLQCGLIGQEEGLYRQTCSFFARFSHYC